MNLKLFWIMTISFVNIWRFYRDGFRNMTWGRVLWLIILLKLFVLFAVLRPFFFPDYIDRVAGDNGESYVSGELIDRAAE